MSNINLFLSLFRGSDEFYKIEESTIDEKIEGVSLDDEEFNKILNHILELSATFIKFL